MSNGWTGALLSGGIGAALASVVTATIQTISRKGEARATAADLITNAASNLTDRLDKMNIRLETENKMLRQSLRMLADTVDEILPLINADPKVVDRLRKSVRAATAVIDS